MKEPLVLQNSMGPYGPGNIFDLVMDEGAARELSVRISRDARNVGATALTSSVVAVGGDIYRECIPGTY